MRRPRAAMLIRALEYFVAGYFAKILAIQSVAAAREKILQKRHQKDRILIRCGQRSHGIEYKNREGCCDVSPFSSLREGVAIRRLKL